MYSFWLLQSFGCCLLQDLFLFFFRLQLCSVPSNISILLYIFVDSFFFLLLPFLLSCYIIICICLSFIYFPLCFRLSILNLLSYLSFLNLSFILKFLDLLLLLSLNSFDFILFSSWCICYFFCIRPIEFLDGFLLFLLDIVDCSLVLRANFKHVYRVLVSFLIEIVLVLFIQR